MKSHLKTLQETISEACNVVVCWHCVRDLFIQLLLESVIFWFIVLHQTKMCVCMCEWMREAEGCWSLS